MSTPNTPSTRYCGIDYDSIGQSNRNTETGIHYGCISVHSLADWVIGECEPIYPESVEVECPECKHAFETKDTSSSDNQTCPKCGHEWQENDLDYVEAIGWDYAARDSQYKTESSESLNAVFVTDSPYYTYARYCSPCAPGAVDLDSSEEYDATDDNHGPKGYCFGHEYFDNNRAPYRVFKVSDDTEVMAESSEVSL